MNKNRWNGRGRGRGVALNFSTTTSRGARGDTGNRSLDSASLLSVNKRFQQASERQLQSAKQVLDHGEQLYESSSDEEDLDNENIVSRLVESYKSFNASVDKSVDGNVLELTSQYLTECCQSGALTCLVCISSIKRVDPIWNCKKCYACFHIACIRQWVLEGIAQASLLSDELFPLRDQPWFCPKCRHKYSRQICPDRYLCFCGSVQDPEPEPWTLPHSCGGTCNKPLSKPDVCGHRCLLLCHPGPCPPCPQTVVLRCHCGKSGPTSRRCGAGKLSCGQKCSRLLACGLHKCQDICHEGECRACEYTSVLKCKCGQSYRQQPCVEPEWSCQLVCARPLSCGFHKCDKVCHEKGKCGECPRSGVRQCPCGKRRYEGLTCVQDAPPCDDTCGKSLGCFGDHKCSRRCHRGPCGACSLVCMKWCRCGKREKEVPCQKEYVCDTRCQKVKTCGKHQCKRKCCDGECPSCEVVCAKSLQCKKHKCQMGCHQGPCYPCPLTSKVTCRCGASAITVVCGQEKSTKPPRCRKACENPPDCHHVCRVRHNCHFGECPPCKQTCGETLACGHTCSAECHDRVLVKLQVPAGLAPWEKPQSGSVMKRLPCPPCQVPVSRVCVGGHGSSTFACSQVRDEFSCGRECGRSLACRNHACVKHCHRVDNAADLASAGSNCMTCEEPCSRERPRGCEHECVSGCHVDECPPCRKRVRVKCHCGMTPLKFLCCEWSGQEADHQRRMQSCGNKCPRMLSSCGHPCPLSCHPESCPSSDQCSKKVTIRCSCHRRKKDFVCSQAYGGKQVVACDEICSKLKLEKAAEKEEKERKEREEEERRNREEVERFERKMNRRGRKPQRSKAPVVTSERGDTWWGGYAMGVVTLVVLAFAFAYHYTAL